MPLIKRAMVSFMLLIVMSFVTFWLMHATPGNFFDALKLNPQIAPSTIERYEQIYGLNDPFIVQWGRWLWNVLHGEFGYSFYYNVPVRDVLAPRLGNTFVLAFSSALLTWGLAIPLGVWAALKRGKLADKMLNAFSFAAFSAPSFFLAMLLLFIFSRIGGLPLGGMHAANVDDLSWLGRVVDLAKHLVIPTIVLSLASIASLQRIMRGSMLSQLGQTYLTALRAKGLPEHRVIYVHALRNAFNPMITLLGYEFASLLSGAALVEIVCSWPGLGSLMLTAVRSKDVYVVMASMLMGGVMLLLGNLLSDVLLLKLDPRITSKKI